jgi:hypothetical protein
MRNTKVVPIFCLGAVIIKYPLIPISPAYNGGRGQFLKVSCHSWGFDSDVFKGILWDSAAMNSEGSEIPTGPRK